MLYTGGQAAFAKYPLSHGVRLVAVQTLVVACRSGELGRTCCHGGWPDPPSMPHTTATGTTAAVSIVSFTRARSRLLQHTAFYTRHTRSASSQRTGTAASEPYIQHTHISTVDRYDNVILYGCNAARDKQKLAVRNIICIIIIAVVLFFFFISFPRWNLKRASHKKQPFNHHH